MDRALLYCAQRLPSLTIGAITYFDANYLDSDVIFEIPIGIIPDASGHHYDDLQRQLITDRCWNFFT